MDRDTRKVLEAVDQLRRYYEGKEPTLYGCPLCQALDDGCERCPWVVLEGAPRWPKAGKSPCYFRGHYPIAVKRYCPSRQWRVASIKRLKRWRRQIISGTYARRVAR